jgi:hypothetical protein
MSKTSYIYEQREYIALGKKNGLQQVGDVYIYGEDIFGR